MITRSWANEIYPAGNTPFIISTKLYTHLGNGKYVFFKGVVDRVTLQGPRRKKAFYPAHTSTFIFCLQ